MIERDMRPALREVIANHWIYVVVSVVYLLALVMGLVVICKNSERNA